MDHEASVRSASSAGASPRTRTVGKEGIVALTPLSTSSRDFLDIILCLDDAASLHHVVSGIAATDTPDATLMTASVSEHRCPSPPSSSRTWDGGLRETARTSLKPEDGRRIPIVV